MKHQKQDILETGLSRKKAGTLNEVYFDKNKRPVSKKEISIIGFTLVELIVVITMLAILGTIAIMAFEGYSKNARDSRRLSDLNNISKSLELFKFQAGNYPDPTDTFNVTYSGAIAWTQGSFGDPTFIKVGNMDKKPTDPLTGTDYTYSVTSTKKEYQVAAIYEGNNVTSKLVNQTYAAEEMKSIINGTYNGKFVKTQTGAITYILGAPSIITSEITSVDIETVLLNKSFVYANFSNLPSSYKSTSYTLTGGFDFAGGTGVVLFVGNLNDLSTSTGKLSFANKLDAYYSVTPLNSSVDYKEIVDVDIIGNPSGAITLINNYVTHKVAGISGVSISSISGGGGGGSGIGVCGKDANKHLYVTPTRLCDTGTPSSVTDGGILGDYTWTCGTTSCSGRHAFPWTYTPADIRNIFSNRSIYTENWDTNVCDPATMTVIDVNPGTDVIPNTIPANTIYRLSAGNYINTTTVNSGPWGGETTAIDFSTCSGLIGNGIVNFYTSNKILNSIVLNTNSIVAGIKFDGLKNGVGGDHAGGSTTEGIDYKGDNTTMYNLDIFNFSTALGYSYNYKTGRNIKIYNNTSDGMNKSWMNYNVFSNIDIYNNSGRGIYSDGGLENLYSNIKIYNNTTQGFRFAYETSSSINNILTFNNGTYGIWGESYDNIINNIYSYNNGSSGYDGDTLGGNSFISNNVNVYNNGADGISIPGYVTGSLLLFGIQRSFGNVGSDFLLTNYEFGNSSPLGFANGTILDTSGTFGASWVVTPSTPGWNINTKGKQSLTFTGGTTYTYGSNIGNQTQPIKYNPVTLEYEPWGVDGIHYDSTKKVGEW